MIFNRETLMPAINVMLTGLQADFYPLDSLTGRISLPRN